MAVRLATRLRQSSEDRLHDIWRAVRMFQREHGRFPRIVVPQTFNEKVLHRKMFDRRALLTRLTDKLARRAFVEERLGREYLPGLYAVADDPESIAFDDLPHRFVVKPTHGSGWVRVVKDKSSLDRADLLRTCRAWLNESYYLQTREWVYRDIPPRILVEEFIDDGRGDHPVDYKLFVFDGCPGAVQVDVTRFTDHRRNLYTLDWKKLDVSLRYPNIDGDVPRPRHLDEMISAARRLGEGIDFLRADFYDAPEKTYLGELTMTPGAGLDTFRPPEFDLRFGAMWRLTATRSDPRPRRQAHRVSTDGNAPGASRVTKYPVRINNS